MDRFDRIFDLHKLLSASRYPVSRLHIEQELECSRATAKRIIDAMRLYLNAPIKYDRELNGYYYDHTDGAMYELPGVWFNSSELHALLSVQQLLQHVQPGLLEQQLAPLKTRIESLLKAQKSGGTDLSQRIRILRAASRPVGEHFQRVSSSVAQRKRLQVAYYQRASDTTTTRTLSPQRLTYYRDNWYLDAYCHLRKALRTFSLDAMQSTLVLEKPAMDIDSETLDRHTTTSYGIFSGQANLTAHLRFNPTRARWVSRESWHPLQQGHWSDAGAYELRIPYHKAEELVMDILKYGADVEVLGPESLRERIELELQKMLTLYRGK